jgi:hypothetical protein
METTIREALVKVLTQIMASLGRPVPTFTDDLKPIEDLEDFNSELWPAAKGMLQKELSILIPPGTNIFREPVTKKPYTLAQIITNLAAALPAWKLPI